MFAIGTADGQLKWKQAAGGDVRLGPEGVELSEDGATVYTGADDGSVYAVDASDGAVKWRYATGSQVRSAPRLSKDGRLLFVGSSDGSVYALRAV